MKMTDFNAEEFTSLRERFSMITQKWNAGRGKKTTFNQKTFFMLLVVLKNGGQWHSLGRVHQMEGSTFDKIISYLALYRMSLLLL